MWPDEARVPYEWSTALLARNPIIITGAPVRACPGSVGTGPLFPSLAGGAQPARPFGFLSARSISLSVSVAACPASVGPRKVCARYALGRSAALPRSSEAALVRTSRVSGAEPSGGARRLGRCVVPPFSLVDSRRSPASSWGVGFSRSSLFFGGRSAPELPPWRRLVLLYPYPGPAPRDGVVGGGG